MCVSSAGTSWKRYRDCCVPSTSLLYVLCLEIVVASVLAVVVVRRAIVQGVVFNGVVKKLLVSAEFGKGNAAEVAEVLTVVLLKG